MNIYRENQNAKSSKMGSLDVYATLSERNSIMSFCSKMLHCVAKGYYAVGALDQDEDMLTQICLFDSQYTDLFSWFNWIAGDSRERVQIKTSQGKNGFFRSLHFKHWTDIVSDFIIRGVSIMSFGSYDKCT